MQELQLYLDRVSALLRAGGRLRDVLASSAEEEAYQKAVLASLATDPGMRVPPPCTRFVAQKPARSQKLQLPVGANVTYMIVCT